MFWGPGEGGSGEGGRGSKRGGLGPGGGVLGRGGKKGQNTQLQDKKEGGQGRQIKLKHPPGYFKKSEYTKTGF